MVSYDDIKRIYRLEQKTPGLGKIDPDFYSSVNESLKGMKGEIENAPRQLLEDLYNYREQKIVLGAIRAQRANLMPENMVQEEKRMYDELAGVLKNTGGFFRRRKI